MYFNPYRIILSPRTRPTQVVVFLDSRGRATSCFDISDQPFIYTLTHHFGGLLRLYTQQGMHDFLLCDSHSDLPSVPGIRESGAFLTDSHTPRHGLPRDLHTGDHTCLSRVMPEGITPHRLLRNTEVRRFQSPAQPAAVASRPGGLEHACGVRVTATLRWE